jgi:hypothetical protein
MALAAQSATAVNSVSRLKEEVAGLKAAEVEAFALRFEALRSSLEPARGHREVDAGLSEIAARLREMQGHPAVADDSSDSWTYGIRSDDPASGTDEFEATLMSIMTLLAEQTSLKDKPIADFYREMSATPLCGARPHVFGPASVLNRMTTTQLYRLRSAQVFAWRIAEGVIVSMDGARQLNGAVLDSGSRSPDSRPGDPLSLLNAFAAECGSEQRLASLREVRGQSTSREEDMIAMRLLETRGLYGPMIRAVPFVVSLLRENREKFLEVAGLASWNPWSLK